MYTVEFQELKLEDLLPTVQSLKYLGARFVQMFAENPESGLDLVYTFYDEQAQVATNYVVGDITPETPVPSIQNLYLSSFSYENEAHDLFGVWFVNMKLDFGGHFFNVAEEAPMAIITPEVAAARAKRAKVRAAQEAKAKAAAAKEKAAAAGAGAAAAGTAQAAATAAAKAQAAADAAPASKANPNASTPVEVKTTSEAGGITADQRAKMMEEKLAAMDPEKAAKVRAALAAKAAREAAAKDGE